MCDEKKKVATLSLLALGAGAAYVLKEDMEELGGEELKELVKNKLSENEERRKEKNPVHRKKFPGKELFGVTYGELRDMLGQNYPGDDMSQIYLYLDEETRMWWRRGIYNNGMKTSEDRLFAYYDAYYLSLAGWKELQNVFREYTQGSADFQKIAAAYMSVIKKLLSTSVY